MISIIIYNNALNYINAHNSFRKDLIRQHIYDLMVEIDVNGVIDPMYIDNVSDYFKKVRKQLH